MDDSTLEREIEGLLSVDPAPDFRARVRHRIAQEPPLQTGGRAWRAIWALAASAAVATAATTLLVVLRVDAPPPVANAPKPRATDRPRIEAPTPTIVAPVVVRLATTKKRPRGSAVPPMEVIIHAPEAAAWRQLFDDVRSGEIDLSRSGRAVEEETAAEAEFMLPPIVIEPLTPDREGAHP